MATIKKPKTKNKAKKTVEINKHFETNNEEIASTSDLSIDFKPSSTKCDEIISHDCFVSTEFQSTSVGEISDSPTNKNADQAIILSEPSTSQCTEFTIIDNDDSYQNTDQIEQYAEPSTSKSTEFTIIDKEEEITNINEIDKTEIEDEEKINTESNLVFFEERSATPQPWTLNFNEPSAPCFEEPSTNIFQPLVKYPALSEIQKVQSEIPNKLLQKTVTKPQPLTSEQLRDIYCCREIEMVKQFEIMFLSETYQENFETDPLYIQLKKYSFLRSKLKMNLIDLANYKSRFNNLKDKIWTEKEKSVKFVGICGDNISVCAQETYRVAVLDGKHLEDAALELSQLYELISFTYTSNTINAQITKLRIDQIIREILAYPIFASINTNTPISLRNSLDPNALVCLNHLKRAISILFSFIRKPSPDKQFTADLKSWIANLVSLHIRIGSKEDHWFLLFHILRCPSGIASWATGFVQMPSAVDFSLTSALASPEINHCVAVLNILLMPIKNRNEFLKSFTQSHKEISDPVNQDLWIIIDSDGEEGSTSTGECVGLKESDLIALLDQIPFDLIFKSVLNVLQTPDDLIIESDFISVSQLLKTIAFSSTLVDLFGKGLLTYNVERYKQFAKRIGRLIRHVLQYISDYNELFIRNNLSKDPHMCDIIKVELNGLLIKACSYIYTTRNLATWQYFSSLPFANLDAATVWQLFYYLNVGFPNEFPNPIEDYQGLFNSTEFWDKFNVTVADSSPEDLYYLLQAFFEMANERDQIKDWELIKSICIHIFNIGFINEQTRDICYKTSRDMLSNLCLAYQELISSILIQVKIRFNEIENCSYLFNSLPLANWKPENDSFEILSNWLLNYCYKTNENMLARKIISQLNWEFDYDGRLFLPHNIHVRMACLIAESVTKHAPEDNGSTATPESFSIQNLQLTQTPKTKFIMWSWSMVSILKLHLMDQSRESIQKTLFNPVETLMLIPELDQITSIYQGVSENRPIAMYISILASLWGHSIPLICQKGLEQIKLLLNDHHRHAVVIRCIQLIVPLFLDCPETLSKCESFQNILLMLLNADRSYLKMAKGYLFPNSIGLVCQLLNDMIHCQVINYVEFGLPSPMLLTNLWLHILTEIPNWQTSSVVILIDKLLQISYQFSDCWYSSKEFFRCMYKNCNEWKSSKSSGFKLLLGTNKMTTLPALTPFNAWFNLILLEIEYESIELRFWPEFLRQIVSSNNNSLESILKKTTTLVGIPSFNPQFLTIYKYANLITTMEVNHPFFPLINQKFFTLFLSRVTYNYEDERLHHLYGVSEKLYEYNVPLMKKIKVRLQLAEKFYAEEATNHADDEEMNYFYKNCSKMMKTYILWLEETDLNKISRDQNINLPPQYNSEKLKDIFSENDLHWDEFLHLPNIRKEQKEYAQNWLEKSFRSKSNINKFRDPLPIKPKTTPLYRIKSHLNSYDKRIDPPVLVKEPLIFESLSSKDINTKTLSKLRRDLKVLDTEAKNFNLIIKELNSLNGNYKDIVKTLYQNIPYQELRFLKCTSTFSKSSSECKKAAEICVNLEQPRKIDNVERKMIENRNRHDKIVKDLIAMNFSNLVIATEQMKIVVKTLLNNNDNRSEINNVAIKFFYDVIRNMNEDVSTFPKCSKICNVMLSKLGIFIQNNLETEGIPILEISLTRPDLLETLGTIFTPTKTAPEHFIKMYKFLLDSHMKRCDSKILFVLLTKFDLASWLPIAKPKLSDISRLLKLISFGLENWNQPENSLVQDVFRRHLIHIFEYEFPEHYGEVLQIVLDGISEQKLMPGVLLDIMNSMLIRCGCDKLSLKFSHEKITEICLQFAKRQKLFNFKGTTDTILLLTRHFQNERLHHGLHGLYPKHKQYCLPLSICFSLFGHVAVVTAICAFPGVLADQISDWIFGSIVDMYSPWLVTYTEENVQSSSANWIRQLIVNGKVLYPWTESQTESAKLMITSFTSCIQFVLESLPVSHSILGHTLSWYLHHFAVANLGPHIRTPIHTELIALPWERWEPIPKHIEMFYERLHEYLPECHSFLGHIFLRTNWDDWIRLTFSSWQLQIQNHVISLLLSIFVQISFEPHLHENPNTSRILENSIKFPWHQVNCQGLENIYKWVQLSVEPAIVLKLPSESNYADRAVLELLKLSSCMVQARPSSIQVLDIQPKRILYVRCMVCLLIACTTKHQKLLDTKNGKISYQNAIIELLDNIDTLIEADNRSRQEKETEAQNIMIEIVGSFMTQNLNTSKLFIDAMIFWQSKCQRGSPVLSRTLNSICVCKTFSHESYSLIEATIFNYFRCNDNNKNDSGASWEVIVKTLQNSCNKLDLIILLQEKHLLTLHAFILCKLSKFGTSGEKITFLQDLSQLLEQVKISETNESSLVIVWGAIISCGCKILSESQNAKKPLLMLASYFQVISNQTESWGEGLLGAIGLKKDRVTNRRKILTRCLACIIYSLFPDRSSEPIKPNKEFTVSLQEMKALWNNKKYTNEQSLLTKVIEIINSSFYPAIEDVPHTIFKIIELCYNDKFLATIPKVWGFERDS